MLGHPLWLAGLLALGIPLALHLWSRRPGRVIRVGSVRHLGGLPPVRRIALRLTERLLLALRLGVLAALALALAQPRIVLPAPGRGTTIVLVAPDLARDAPVTARWIDSLRGTGAEVRRLAAGFPELGPAAQAGPGSGTVVPAGGREPSLWDRIAEADRRLPAGGRFVVLAGRGASALGGRRPVLSRPVEWRSPAEPGPRWTLAAAWSGPGRDSVEVLLSEGDSTARRLHRRAVPGSAGVHQAPGVPPLEVRASAGGKAVRLLSADADGSPASIVELPPLRVAVGDTAPVRQHRLTIAARVLGEATGRPVLPAAAGAPADLLLSTSVEGTGGRPLQVEPRWLGLTSLPDSLLPRWPAATAPRPAADQRQVALAQALPVFDPDMELAGSRSRNLRVALLWLALLLFLVERWLASRRPAGPR